MRKMNCSAHQMLGRVSPFALAVGGFLGLAAGAAAQDVPPPAQSPKAATPQPAGADSRVSEIVVTATRRSESVQNIPSSISAVSMAEIEQSGATDLKSIVSMVPGVAFTQNSTGQAVFAIRGIQTSSVVGNLQQPVALYYDDVPVLDLTIPWAVPELQLFDVERVEVLRGPQGTLFGAGALSGALRVITSKPDLSNYQAATEDTVSSTNGGGVGYATHWMVNVPVVQDQLAVRAVGYYDSSPGWIDNPTLGERNTNSAIGYGGRVETEWRPDENFQLVATFADEVVQPHDSGYVPYGSSSDVADNRIRNYNDGDTKIFNLNASYTMPWATLTSSTSYIDRDATSHVDFSYEAGAITGLSAISPLLDAFKTNDFLQEVRLSSSQEHPFKWLVGAFFEDYHFRDCETITQAGSGAAFNLPTDYLEAVCIKTKITDEAGFGEVSYDLGPGLTATAGARYSHYSINSSENAGFEGPDLFDGSPYTASQPASSNSLTPKFSVSYQPDESAMIYALADKGFRTGNSNLNAYDPFSHQKLPSEYGPDSLWNYELGEKAELLDHKLQINADIYYIDWSRIQFQVRDAHQIPYTANVGTATSKGLEFEIVGKPTHSTEVGGSINYTDAEITSVAARQPATVGDQLPGSAPFTSYVYGQIEFPLTDEISTHFRADYSYTGKEFSTLMNKDNPTALTYGNYSTIGLRATVDKGPYDLTLFVENLADSRKRVAARTYVLENQELLQTPRTIGVTFRAAW